jgi:predicted phosphodiesterase
MDKLPDFLQDFKKCDYLFLAGDIGYPNYPEYNKGLFYEFICWCTDNYKKVFFVMGNHESYNNDMLEVIESIRQINKEKPNFIFLEKGIISDLESYKVIGCTLWSHADREAFQYMNDKNFIKINDKKLERLKLIELHKEDKKWIKNNVDKNTIVMTHHLPSFNLIHPDYQNFEFEKYNSAYASECDDLIKKAKIWINGHTHKASDKILYNTRCICNPRGYINQPDINNEFNIDVFEI